MINRIRQWIKKHEWADLIYVFNIVVILWALSSMSDGLSFVNISLFISSILSSIGRWRRWWGLAFMPYIITLGVFIRIQNLPLLQNRYPLALDPYYFLRLARTHLETGTMVGLDLMREAPIGVDTANNFFVLTIVYLYKSLKVFIPTMTLEFAAILNPVIFFGAGLIAFFMAIKRAVGTPVALVSSLVLTVIPTYLYRTMAGFSDHESVAMFFFFISMWAFVALLKDNPHRLWWAAFAGISAGFMGLAWSGVRLLMLSYMVYYIYLVLTDNLNLHKTFELLLIILGYFITRYFFYLSPAAITSQLTSIYYAPFFGLIAYGFIRHGIRKIKLPYNVPKNFALMGVGLILTIILGSIIIGPIDLAAFFFDALYQVFRPLGAGRIELTVAEMRVPYLSDWISQFGFLFWSFLAGAALMSYNLGKKFGKVSWFMSAVAVIVIAMLFSSKSPYSVLDASSLIAFMFFFSGMLIAGAALIGFWLFGYYKKKSILKSFKKIEGPELFMLLWWLVMVLSARAGMRVFFTLAPAAAMMAGYLLGRLGTMAYESKELVAKIGLTIIILLVAIPLTLVSAGSSIQQARYTGPSFNAQWIQAMSWVQSDTADDAVFSHWWDYGYWVQTEGGRATIVDGGDPRPYWRHLVGRHVLSARSYEEALEFLYSHNVTHLLIISDEIGKYTAYSSIGSDEEFDVFSWIGTFVMNPQSTDKTDEVTNYFFQGATNLDEPFEYEGETYNKETSVITGFKIPVKNDDNPREMEVLQPLALLSKNGNTEEIPVQCLFDGEINEYDDYGIGGCVRIFPRILNQRYQQENGALLWVSKRGFSALWTRLFLFNEENPYFELAYDDSNRNRLALYGSRTAGPLKIWKVNYPENFTINESLRQEYLADTSPYWEKINAQNKYESPLLN